jgi:hypothetical protein
MPAAHRAALDAAKGQSQTIAEVATADAAPAPEIVTLPPSAFSAEWANRPKEPARVGLRLVGEAAVDQARAEATADVDRMYAPHLRDTDEAIHHWNGVFMRGVLGGAMCQPHDVTRSWFKAMAADMVGVALNERGVQRLWQAYGELREKLSPLLPLASPEDLSDLSKRLAMPDAIGRLHEGDRRILRRILDDLREAG